MSRWLDSSRPQFGGQFLLCADNTCVVCLRGEVLVLLVSVRLADVANFVGAYSVCVFFACEACLSGKILTCLPVRLACVAES